MLLMKFCFMNKNCARNYMNKFCDTTKIFINYRANYLRIVFFNIVKMLILFETPAGYALFEVSDEKKFKKIEKLNPESLNSDSLN